MKNILVPVEEHNLIDAVIDTALGVARRFDSYVEGIAVSVDQISAYAADLHFGVVPGLDPVSRQEMADAARHRFENAMLARGVTRAGPLPGFGWKQDLLTGDELVGAYARVFDLTVLGRPSSRTGHPRMATVEAALFDSGRPVLLVPPAPVRHVGEELMIAWNRSTETANAVAHAMPFLKRAKTITVLEIENWGVAGPTGSISSPPSSGTACRSGSRRSPPATAPRARPSSPWRRTSAATSSSKARTPRAAFGR